MNTNESHPRSHYFAEDGRELVITEPKLRRPWRNYMSGENYGLKFSQTGGGFSVFPILEGRQITRYDESHDQSGRYVYVRDDENGEFWSLNWQPVRKDLDEYECRHGLGYSLINSKRKGISHSLLVHPLTDVPGEMWTLRVRNEGKSKRRLSLYPFVDWHLGDGAVPWDNPSWYTNCEFRGDENVIVATYFGPADSGEPFSVLMKPFFEINGFCCGKRVFCGFTGNLAEPEALRIESLRHDRASGEETIGCFQRTATLAPGETTTLQLLIAPQKNERNRGEIIGSYSNQAKRDATFEDIRRFWDGVVAKHEIKTPDPVFDRWINIWLKYQEHQCFKWAGLGDPNAPLMGYRDVLQHTLAMSLFAPDMAKDRLLEALRHQYRNGRAVRQWSRKGTHDRRDYRDSPVWIVFSLCAYIKETGDLTILDADVPYLDDDGEDTVMGHAMKALKALCEDLGEHGLSHLGEGDWYDPLNKAGVKGRGESVWLTMSLITALNEMAELFEFLGKPEEAKRCAEKATTLANSVNEHGWDGEWYLYGYDDDGGKIGSRKCEEGRFYPNAQTWAIISGVAAGERLKACFDSLEKHKTPFGYPIATPRYTLKNQRYGNVGTLRSHSRAYSHVGAFHMAACCLAGNGDDAYETFKLIDPGNPAHPPEATQADPHIIPNGYAGVSADANEAVVLHSGSSGAFPWILKTVIEHMAGAKADYQGLRVRPCLPTSWRTVSIRREFRGVVYNIVITKSNDPRFRGPKISVDGEPIKGDLVKTTKAEREGDERSVTCVVGSRR